jgi:anti-sigma regulatory factor (Ser/Thr protein kinase)
MQIPHSWRAEIRLGLQEALVNAAKHGNKLDPSKTIVVEFHVTPTKYSWIITDQGIGFVPQDNCHQTTEESLPPDESENGRGLCILYEVFDFVHWDRQGNQLTLYKQVKANALSK